MNSFQNYVFAITLMCLIIALTITAIVLKNQKSNESYPPKIDNCPDYWYNSYHDIDSSGKSVKRKCTSSKFGCCPDNITSKTDETGTNCSLAKCYNVQNLGERGDSCNTIMDFSKFTTCEKQTWAKKCNITWDGITNVPSACNE